MSFANKTKHYLQDLFRYSKMRNADEEYDTYWQNRDTGAELNSFQKKRAEFLIREIDKNDSILDIGCGDGRILVYLKEKGHQGEMLGVDSSDYVLSKAKSRGVAAIKKDIRDVKQLSDLGVFGVVILFEVLEHMVNAEELLAWAYSHSRKAVIFSVPNTGFIVHRLRLLFGRFPLQWRVHPSEHLRFWTLRDMKWWLNQLGYNSAVIKTYEGFLWFGKLSPSIFSEGIFVSLRKKI